MSIGDLAVALVAIVAAYALGSVPVAFLAARASGGIDLREHGSGNPGASNVGESVSRWLMIPVGLAQIAQGLGAVLIAVALDQGDGVRAACGIAAVIANDWNPWLRLSGGRGIGATIGVLLALSPLALAVFIVIAVIGIPRAVPLMMLIALVSTPLTAAVAGIVADDVSLPVVAGCALLALIAAAKRLLANAPPAASAPRPQVWLNRVLFDRDVADREAWVRGSRAP